MLCEICQNIFRGTFHSPSFTLFNDQPHHKTIANLHEAALSGCSICIGLLGAFMEDYWRDYDCADGATIDDRTRMFLEDQDHGPRNESVSSDTLSLYPFSDQSDIGYSLTSPDKDAWENSVPSSKQPCLSFHLRVAPRSGSSRPLKRTAEFGHRSSFLSAFFHLSPIQDVTLPESANSVANLNWPLYLGKHWLETCIKNHPDCNLSGRPQWLPTRLLELDAPVTNFLRLVPTQGNQRLSKMPYITLSHCWGHTELFKLQQDTISQLSAGIDVSTLPQTFQDAIKVALSLGVKLMWIDSLCIFQDSKDDWSHESSLMGVIYLNGLCNIAATAAKDGNGGLLHKRINPIPLDCYVRSTWEDATNRCWRVDLSFFVRAVLLDGPLIYRGWVVQERVMARRVLHFGARQMYWECQELDACETYPKGIPRFGQSHPSEKPFKSKHHGGVDVVSQIAVPTSHLLTQRLRFWHLVLCAYTQCQLTYEEDKLVAISGLAKAFQTGFGETEYLAGLWRMCLIQDLCWALKDPPGRRPLRYRAPSWSWASVDGTITDAGHRGVTRNYGEFEKGTLAQILEASVELRSSDSTGEVTGGFVRLQGYLMTINIARSKESSFEQDEWETTLNGVLVKTKTKVHQNDIDKDGHHLHCMPMQWWDYLQILENPPAIQCLLLEPVGYKKGQFRRYGYVRLEYESHNIRSWATVQNDKWFEFEEDVGDGEYIVTII